MKKIAIFNVGGASSAYIEIDTIRIVIDLGAGNDFSPVNDFLIPLSIKRQYKKDESTNKIWINQLFLTHLDNDHVTDYLNFSDYFMTELLTAPSDHSKILEKLKIKREKVPNNDIVKKVLDDMQIRIPGRHKDHPDYEKPLSVYDTNTLSLYYIPPDECEKLDNLSEDKIESYKNNISLLIILNIDNHIVVFPGDLMNSGIEYLIANNPTLRKTFESMGVDFLVAPHHGLSTSFPVSLFQNIKDNKVRLSIISEKELKKTDKENRNDVDTRYYQKEYSKGYKVESSAPPQNQFAIATSKHIEGHILIDFDSSSPIIKRCSTEELLNEFTQ